jgi:hypothetical protein
MRRNTGSETKAKAKSHMPGWREKLGTGWTLRAELQQIQRGRERYSCLDLMTRAKRNVAAGVIPRLPTQKETFKRSSRLC